MRELAVRSERRAEKLEQREQREAAAAAGLLEQVSSAHFPSLPPPPSLLVPSVRPAAAADCLRVIVAHSPFSPLAHPLPR